MREKIRGNTKRKQNNNRFFLTLVEKIIKTNLLDYIYRVSCINTEQNNKWNESKSIFL